MRYTAKSNGTCGELVQGYVDGKDFLINSPIPFFAEAQIAVKHHKSDINPCLKNNIQKFQKILNKLLLSLNIRENIFFDVEINSNIPRGKGLASSTAELTAALLAASAALNRHLSDDEITKLLLSVDGSSDGVHLPGIAHMNHLNGEIYRKYSHIPSLSFIIVDVGGEIKTQEFDRNFARRISVEHEFSIRRALSLIERGFAYQNSKLIAQAATISTRINQHILYKAPLDTLIEGTREFGGLGVNCGHTGTILGVMFDHQKTDAKHLLERVHELIHPLPILGVYPLIAGERMDEQDIQAVNEYQHHHHKPFGLGDLKIIVIIVKLN